MNTRNQKHVEHKGYTIAKINKRTWYINTMPNGNCYDPSAAYISDLLSCIMHIDEQMDLSEVWAREEVQSLCR